VQQLAALQPSFCHDADDFVLAAGEQGGDGVGELRGQVLVDEEQPNFAGPQCSRKARRK
jgi:hypothetical protein